MPYRILSLDGGASWAMVQARILQDLYKEEGDLSGHLLLSRFDMVIATSGGSVLLGLLCNNMTLSEIVAFYNNPCSVKQLYPTLYPWEHIAQQVLRLFQGVGAKYSARRKLDKLRQVFKEKDRRFRSNAFIKPIIDTYLNDLPDIISENNKLQLIITGFDYFRQRVSFFRSNNYSRTRHSKDFYQITLGEAIHASTNAPINYYDRPARAALNLLTDVEVQKDRRCSWYWDGAVAGFNNPVLAGLVEAVTNNTELNIEDFHVLSIGTSQSRKAIIIDDTTSDNAAVKEKLKANKGKPFVDDILTFGFLTDIQKMSESILSDPPDSATFIAYSFINRSLKNEIGKLVRINPHLTPESKAGIYDYPMAYNATEEDRAEFIKLMNLDFDIAKEADLKMVSRMCDRFITETDEHSLKNQLIREEIDSSELLGDPTYRKAKERWMALK